MRYGIRSISMDEIANHLGMSKKTIYQFYADKDSLVDDVINIEINKSKEDCTGQRSKSENALQEVFLAIDMVQEMLKHMNPSVLYDLEKYHAKAYRKFTEHKNKFFTDVIKTNLEWGIKDGLYRDDLNIDLLTRFRLVSMFLMFDTENFPVSKFSASDVVAAITDNFIMGISTPKGQKLIQKYKQQRQKSKP